MTHHTPFYQRVKAEEARRKPCPECGGKYVERWKRPLHAMSCSLNPLTLPPRHTHSPVAYVPTVGGDAVLQPRFYRCRACGEPMFEVPE